MVCNIGRMGFFLSVFMSHMLHKHGVKEKQRGDLHFTLTVFALSSWIDSVDEFSKNITVFSCFH